MHISSPTPSPGNIPAYAGRTAAGCAGYCCNSKHPRIRGENRSCFAVVTADPETSPHTRGEPSASAGPRCKARNIPAYAGRTIKGAGIINVSRKHPRIRGENAQRCVSPLQPLESAPHTRGEPPPLAPAPPNPGNIPAYAGRTKAEIQLCDCR